MRGRATALSTERGVRNRALDTIRFALIAAVMAYHYTVRWRPPHNPHDLYHYDWSYPEYFEIGAYGVHLFFMLSGFFIAVALAKYGDGQLFLSRRLLRIYPAFLICCTLTFALTTAMPPGFVVGPRDYVLSLGFLAENVGARFVDGAYWSLAVEMKFYLIVCVSFITLRERYWIGLIGLGFAGAALGIYAPKVAKEILLAPYLPMFLVGLGLAQDAMFGRRTAALALYAAGVVLLAIHRDVFTLQGEPSGLVAFCVAAAMGSIVLLVRSGLDVGFGPIPYLGVISYEIYLLHQKIGVTIIGVARGSLGLPDLGAIALAVAVVVGSAALVHEILQRPIQAAMERAWALWARSARTRP